MKRSRKWAYVSQEAIRLGALGLSPREIGDRIGVDQSTVNRWMKAGKIGQKGLRKQQKARAAKETAATAVTAAAESDGGASPAEWAKAVRTDYQLDATDEQLVCSALAVLTVARDEGRDFRERLAAMAEFRAVVKQLALVARGEEVAGRPVAGVTRPEPVARTDPRQFLMVVNK